MGVTELRKSGKLQEALDLALTEFEKSPDNIWSKRNLVWVYFDFLKKNQTIAGFDEFLNFLDKIIALNLPKEETILYDQVAWQCGVMANKIASQDKIDSSRLRSLFGRLKDLPFTKPGKGYSILFQGFHKGFKDSVEYIGFADWWGFDNFMEADFQKEKSKEGKQFMSIVEQAYIAYSKHLLPVHDVHLGTIFNEERAKEFMPRLDKLIESHPEYQYPEYFKGKLLVALGQKGNLLEVILPFVKKKKRDFWAWDILSEAFPANDERGIACLAKAITCEGKEDYLVNIRQRLAAWLISVKRYSEAKTEILLLVKTRQSQKWPIPEIVSNWMKQDWYVKAAESQSNHNFYKSQVPIADGILFADNPTETIIVDFVNTDRKILNFIASETKFGFFKYENFLTKVSIGNTLKVRFSGGGSEGLFLVLTLEIVDEPEFAGTFTKEVEGNLRIPEGRSFGFLNDIVVFPNIISKFNLKNGQQIHAKCIKNYNQEKKQWGWKVYDL
jgi:hypothetical protein